MRKEKRGGGASLHGSGQTTGEREPREKETDRKEREMAGRLIGVSDMAAESSSGVCGLVESCKAGRVLSDGSRCAYYGIRRVQSVGPCRSHRKETVGLVCTDGSCVLMERDDCGMLGSYVREVMVAGLVTYWKG
ncbi:hypothetical protein YC2023_083105 [Brassica napus]